MHQKLSSTNLLLLCFLFPAFSSAADYQLLETRNYPKNLFTQGLVTDSEFLYISSGLYGKSKILKRDLTSGEIQISQKLPRKIFAEGITLLGDKLYLLSWKAGRAWQLDKETLTFEQQFKISGEGWGITHNGENLITSDGSNTLYFRNTDDLSVEYELLVTQQGNPVYNLNELEFVDGKIWANIWKQTRIIAIDPSNGEVTKEIDLHDLVNPHHNTRKGNVLNGIAWDKQQQAFWITGKRWPEMYLMRP
ncbi:glutaminyl-peptide cyclotransferase [Maricurvus nonylphenolicus]|uniref:glutaminyl-peptide cyclotransferase n=1 Tax=Maricurvus nonylphenolicus TaxID=1008307 RepID=UPI0036F1A486